ncbi:hypothetical protein ENSA5_61710 [Enhygromyxa salina]|uniref:Anti-sigma factor n=1 Tax=Enhygromyxa salina TaxID=215803 RepID=A0A2S9XD01_9BACT|nr:anti-sigma factor [Enhygromyxa salina]PRP90737.1 hypothetical protein ENSA5_61710 [Enhygromyxa salina]
MGHRAPASVVCALLTLLTLLPLGACSNKRTYEFETSPPANAGEVELALWVDKTGNGRIKLEFEHLAPPSRIDPSLQSYVVWATSDGRDPYKLGIVVYDAKKRTGSLDATFSNDWLKVIVTLEKDGLVATPTGTRVLEQVIVAPQR